MTANQNPKTTAASNTLKGSLRELGLFPKESNVATVKMKATEEPYFQRLLTGADENFQISANNSFPAPSTCWAYSKRGQLLSRKGEPVFYAFDLLWLDGEDLRRRPLVERKSDSRDSSGPRSVQGCFTRSTSSGAGRAFSQKFALVTWRGL